MTEPSPAGADDAPYSIISATGELAVRNLTVRFGGVTALHNVSLDAGEGRVVGIIGPNGAGKTTLFNAICGFVDYQGGEIRWRERPLRTVSPHQLAGLGIARTLQAVGLFSRLSVLENVMVGAERLRRAGVLSAMLGLPRSDTSERRLRVAAMGALARVGAVDVADRLPKTLPYGIQKRVALARALVAEPALLLLDEPAGGLGSDDLDELAQLIGSLRGTMTVMLVEHHMDLVMGVCDDVVVFDFGRVIARGSPAEVQRDQRVLDAYLGVSAQEASSRA
jgi:branched-chain amino acid transport system ATP-binding protein